MIDMPDPDYFQFLNECVVFTGCAIMLVLFVAGFADGAGENK